MPPTSNTGPVLIPEPMDAATRAASAFRQGATGREKEKAAALLLHTYGARLQRYFAHNKASGGEAEELVQDVMMKFILRPLPQDCRAEPWLWTLARNTLVDWARESGTIKRSGGVEGGHIEVHLDDDSMMALLETDFGHSDLDALVRECVHKAAALMQKQEPRQAEVLMMVYLGWSAEEIALFFGADPAKLQDKKLSDKLKAAARDRVYRATQAAREFFAHCKE